MLKSLAHATLLSVALSGCGLKGGLYLPPAATPPTNPTPTTPPAQNPATPTSAKPVSP